ncbi:MAG: sigma-70 family RNA polymerase sigma factor [Pirellulales bacterium]|jgi:RNA polymerase sigma-70 factor (ECF subfamily)|nr:sigma-70 family RNA polymerase sigma factor [Thermoguttaceae bacterium]MDD4788103.1 sigma-70 family RNA polymerase sigma factor [Pirellulales bacterium]NLZ01154.1 sigma-70 family RNA polymerase sigma factor [Pirellulaceae bacterium]
MTPPSESDLLLTQRIRAGEADAWSELIARFEGRLLAFVESRLRSRAVAEDVVQETFIGFLTSLPNYDDSRPLETYLFSIAAHKLTDHLRREGRRPTLPLVPGPVGSSSFDPAGPARAASSIYRSSERRQIEEQALVEAIDGQLRHWRGRGDWRKIQCAELLFVRGWPNKQVAAALDISEQAVANTKFDFLARLRTAIRSQLLPRDVFPELYEVE